MTPATILWFRRDLRLRDHPALTFALTHRVGPVIATFVADEALLAPAGPARLAFLRASLYELNDSLDGRLVVRRGDPADQLLLLAREVGADHVVATADFGPYGRARDVAVKAALEAQGITVTFLGSNYVVEPGTVRTLAGTPCRVFGAFRRQWETFTPPPVLSAPHLDAVVGAPSVSLDEVVGSSRRPHYFGDLPDGPPPTLPPAGERAADVCLVSFTSRVANYDHDRDPPGLEGTSRLSTYLRFGVLHPRQVLAVLAEESSGRRVFVSEIAWREFYADVLWHHPESVRRNLQPTFDHLRVDRDQRAEERFRQWARGETGFPLVDAGMRQLLREGWMHNRVRMVCASFLVKHLHLDWRWGARWFMWRLVDGDVASNQHGWQWTAGTGTDAAPFYRIFNPTRQAERFDSEGVYVRRYVDELAHVHAPQCLQPGGGEGLLAPAGYPAAMIDPVRERDDALERLAEAKALAKVSS